MVSFHQFVYQDIWHWVGSFVLLVVVTTGLGTILGTILSAVLGRGRDSNEDAS